MKLYKLHDLFMLGGKTRENYPLLVIGHTTSPQEEVDLTLINAINNLIIPDDCTLPGVDIILAEQCQTLSSAIDLVGCTIKVPGFTDNTGGVLGNPHTPMESACGECEEAPAGWKILTFPGGPGIAFQSEKAINLDVIKNAVQLPLQGKEYLYNLAKQAYEAGVDSLLAVTDGTGKEAKGSAVIQHKRDYMLWSLDEV